MCDNCVHKAVCSIYRATGGKKQCEHYRGKYRPETIVTLQGYNAEALVLIAEMLRKHWITEDKLDTFFNDFAEMYNIIIAEQKMIFDKNMVTLQLPGPVEVFEKLWEGRYGKE